MDLSKSWKEVESTLFEVKERIEVVRGKGCERSKEAMEVYLEELTVLIADVGVCLFNMRYLSWSLVRDYQAAGNPALLQFSYQKLRDEIKDNMYSLSQLSQALQERSRSIRAMYVNY